MPVWVGQADVDAAQAAADKEKRRIAQEQLDRQRRDEEERSLAEQRAKDAAAVRENRQREMQAEAGAQARDLQLEMEELLDHVVRQEEHPSRGLYPSFEAWIAEQRLDHWDSVTFATEIEDYGMSTWKDRKLETVTVRATVQDRNRTLGENRSSCFILGGIFDKEFDVYRHPVETRCEGGSEQIANWKSGNRFESLWIAP